MVVGVGTSVCHNCGASLYGRFCASCGQEDRPLDPTIGELAQEVGRELSDLDGRIVRSMRVLFLSPGFLTREYAAGRRAAWVPPVRLYLTFSVLLFALASLTGQSPIQFHLTISGGPGEGAAGAARELQSYGFTSPEELERWVNDVLATWFPRAMFVLVPLFAWLVSRAQKRWGQKYPQHLIFALHIHAAIFGVQALTLPAIWLGGPRTGMVLTVGALIYFVAYVAIALRRAYGDSTRRAIPVALSLILAYWFAVVLASAAMVVPALFWRRATL
jgi:hypothetical protein